MQGSTAGTRDDRPTVRIVNFSDRGGGAARAAVRLHQALRHQGTSSWLRVAVQRSDDPFTLRPASRFGRVAAHMRPLAMHAMVTAMQGRGSAPRSPAVFATGLASELNRCAEDVVNLHWVGAEMVSIAEIGRIRRPIVWTLHDAWTFSGAEHLLEPSQTRRHVDGYNRQNRPESMSGPDLDRWTWRRKRRAWQRPMTLVCPSEWLAGEARKSMLCRNWPIFVIPNCIDTEQWRPIDQAVARDLLQLPHDKRLILFGAMGGTSDRNKGADLLLDALRSMQRDSLHEVELVIFGQSAAAAGEHWPVPVHYLGNLSDEVSLILAYSSADVMVVPSRIENLPYTAIEAQACGTPVVAFATGGIPECVKHGETGYLASVGSAGDLADGLQFVLANRDRSRTMGASGRDLVLRRFSSTTIADRYVAVYRQALREAQRLT